MLHMTPARCQARPSARCHKAQQSNEPSPMWHTWHIDWLRRVGQNMTHCSQGHRFDPARVSHLSIGAVSEAGYLDGTSFRSALSPAPLQGSPHTQGLILTLNPKPSIALILRTRTPSCSMSGLTSAQMSLTSLTRRSASFTTARPISSSAPMSCN